jgi:VIT1/CCC1 family predicted Fe2+/Mn2+ transporter
MGGIDAVLFVLGNLFYRSQRARFFRGLKGARNEAEALSIHPGPERSRRSRSRARAGRDFWSACVVFALVSATALPGVLPFLLLKDPELAIRVSNLVLVLLLFIVGCWWGHYTDARP